MYKSGTGAYHHTLASHLVMVEDGGTKGDFKATYQQSEKLAH